MVLTESTVSFDSNWRSKMIGTLVVLCLLTPFIVSTQYQDPIVLILFSVGVCLYCKPLKHKLDIQKAIDSGEFYLHYHPIVCVQSGTTKTIGVEVLLRWEHHQHGNIPPAKFIKYAEDNQLIIPLSQHVFTLLEQDIGRYSILQEVGFISVNISAKHLDTLKQDSTELLAQNVFINFEITEHSEYANCISFSSGENPTHQITNAGFFLDDFGTGFNTFSSIFQYRLSAIKLDKSLTEQIYTNDLATLDMVKHIKELADQFYLMIIAEGVEHDGQRERLIQLGITVHQGFLYSYPLHIEELNFKLASSLKSKTVEDHL